MKRTLLWKSAPVVALAVALALGGCSKKQVREEAQVAPAPVVAAEPAPAPAPAPKPMAKVEPPPAATGAVESVPAKVEPAPPPPPPRAGLSRIHFDFDESLIRPDARDIMAKNARFLAENPAVRVRIEGHCDERGTTEYNLALGERRAKSAYDYLMDLGVDPNRMGVVSYGEEVPMAPEHTEDAWAVNRRAEFVEIQR